LLDLVRLCQRAAWLKIEDFHDVRFGKDMMTALHALDKAESSQKRSQIVETDVGVRSTVKNLSQKLLAHNPHYGAVLTW
jgi:hypothetical protein